MMRKKFLYSLLLVIGIEILLFPMYKYIEKATKILLVEVKVYDDYLRGETYGFVLEKDGEELDSCWGFYGSDFCTNGMKEQIKKEYQPLVDAVDAL